MNITDDTRANKTDAGNGSKAACRVSNVHPSPSPDPKRSAKRRTPMKSTQKNLDSILQKLCGLGPDDKTDLPSDHLSIRSRFDGSNPAEFLTITPRWDLRLSARRFNRVIPDAIEGARLYIAERSSLIAYCPDREIYQHSRYLDFSSASQILRVIDHWERTNSLTPPLFFQSSDLELRKVDGHHRVTVALLSEAPYIPIYCKEDLRLPGIVLASPSLLQSGSWTADQQ